MIPGRLAPLGRAWFWVLGSTQRANCSGDWLRYLYIVRQQWLWVCQEGLWFIIDFSSFHVSVHLPWWINSQAERLAVRKYHTALPSQSIYCWDHDHVEEWISVQVLVRCFNLQAETRILDVNNACPPFLVSCCPYHLTIYSWSNPPKPVDLEKKLLPLSLSLQFHRDATWRFCVGMSWVGGPFCKGMCLPIFLKISTHHYSSTPKWSIR